MKKKTSRKRHLFLTKNFIMMLVMLVVIIVAVSAWFTVNKKVTADNISVKAGSTDVQIAKVTEGGGPGVFSPEIEFGGPFTFIRDCTGDGETLIVPAFNVTRDFESVRREGGKEVNEAVSGTAAVEFNNRTEENPEYQYYQFQFFIRSNSPDIFLDPESLLLSKRERDDKKSLFSNEDSPTIGEYGNNVDGLVGAIRVSLIAEACTYANQTWTGSGDNRTVSSSTVKTNDAERQVLWDPRPDVHLVIPSTEKDITNWSLSQLTDFSNYSPYYYLNKSGDASSTESESELGIKKITNDRKIAVSNTMGTYAIGNNEFLYVPHLSDSVLISNFSDGKGFTAGTDGTVSLAPDKNTDDTSEYKNYYLVKYTMNIWIEGTDNEARRAMDGGEFYLNMKFR